MTRMQSMERMLHQSLLQSSSKLEKMMDEQIFYCSQSLINVMSLVETKVSQSTEQIMKAKESLEDKLDGVTRQWSSFDQVIAGRMQAHEVMIQSQVRQLSSSSDVQYRSLVNSVNDVMFGIKSMNQSLIGQADPAAAATSRGRSVTLNEVSTSTRGVDEQLKKIDMDVETYTKKVVNNMSDLWRISKSVETMANSSARTMNQTFDLMMRELSAMNHSLGHDLPSVLSIVHRSLDTRFTELADKVLESHNVILVNQNHFRDSCLRIQGEEGQVYDEFDARLEIMNSTMFSMIDMESRMSERMDKKLHDIFTLMEKTVRFVKQRFRELPDPDVRLSTTSASPMPIVSPAVGQASRLSPKQAASKPGE